VLTLGRFGNPHLAEEATQSAIIALAGKAGRLRRRTIIAGWLHRAVHFAALKLLRAETRRKRWEEQAAAMDLTGQDERAFQEYTLPHVDVALSELSDSERDAVVLRFLRRQSLREVAQSLGTSEEAAKKRVSRALEKLRALLARRGIVLPVAALAAGAGRWLTVVSPEEPEGAARAAGLRARPNLSGSAPQSRHPSHVVCRRQVVMDIGVRAEIARFVAKRAEKRTGSTSFARGSRVDFNAIAR